MRIIRTVLLSAAAATAFAGVTSLTVATPAGAAVRTKARPKPQPTPTVAPTPTSVILTSVRPDLVYGLVRPAADYLEYQLLSGPGVGSNAPIERGVAASFFLENLQAASTYTYRIRNIGVGVAPSAWTTFTVTTAATFASRPPAPMNLRVLSRTATTVTVTWDAPGAGSFQYRAFVDETPLLLPVGPYSYETRQRTFPVPAPGVSVTVTVTARDSMQNLSLPATLVVTG